MRLCNKKYSFSLQTASSHSTKSQLSWNHRLRYFCNCIFNWHSFWGQSERNRIWPIQTAPAPCRLFWKSNIDNVSKIQMQRKIQWYNYKRINFIWRPAETVNTSPLSTPKKRLENTTPIEITNKFSSLINISTTTVHAIRNLNDSNIQGDLPLTKKPSLTTKHFDHSIIFNISEKKLLPSKKSVLEKGLNFGPEIPGRFILVLQKFTT